MKDTSASNTTQTSAQTSAGGMLGVMGDTYILISIFITGLIILDISNWLLDVKLIYLSDGISRSLDYLSSIGFLITPVAGILFVYRSIALKRVKIGLAVLKPLRDRMSFPKISGIFFLIALYIALVNLWLSGLMFFLGFLVATGAGQAIKVVGLNRVSANSQRLFISISCLVLLVSSWLGQGVTLSYEEAALNGALAAPLMGMIAGFFLPVEI